MKKLFLILLGILFLVGCGTVQQRYSTPPENPAPNQVFPGNGYTQTYNPNADALFLALRGCDSNGLSLEGPTDFPSRPLRSLDRRNHGFWLENDEYWDGERWVYPRRRHRPRWPHYPWYTAPRQPRPEPEPDPNAGSSFNGGPVHREQGFRDNGPHSSGIPGQVHPPGSTHR